MRGARTTVATPQPRPGVRGGRPSRTHSVPASSRTGPPCAAPQPGCSLLSSANTFTPGRADVVAVVVPETRRTPFPCAQRSISLVTALGSKFTLCVVSGDGPDKHRKSPPASTTISTATTAKPRSAFMDLDQRMVGRSAGTASPVMDRPRREIGGLRTSRPHSDIDEVRSTQPAGEGQHGCLVCGSNEFLRASPPGQRTFGRPIPGVGGAHCRSAGSGGGGMGTCGVEFADGRAWRSRRSTVDPFHLPKDDQGFPTQIYVGFGGGGGGSGGWRFGVWVYPLPPDGPLKIFVALPPGRAVNTARSWTDQPCAPPPDGPGSSGVEA